MKGLITAYKPIALYPGGCGLLTSCCTSMFKGFTATLTNMCKGFDPARFHLALSPRCIWGHPVFEHCYSL